MGQRLTDGWKAAQTPSATPGWPRAWHGSHRTCLSSGALIGRQNRVADHRGGDADGAAAASRRGFLRDLVARHARSIERRARSTRGVRRGADDPGVRRRLAERAATHHRVFKSRLDVVRRICGVICGVIGGVIGGAIGVIIGVIIGVASGGVFGVVSGVVFGVVGGIVRVGIGVGIGIGIGISIGIGIGVGVGLGFGRRVSYGVCDIRLHLEARK